MHLDIGFADHITSEDNHFLQLPMSISLQSDIYPYLEENKAVWPNFTDSGYEIEAAISQYFIDNILYELHKNGLIDVDTGDLLGDLLNVGWVRTGTGGNWTGFDDDAPCKVILTSLDPYPQFIIHPDLSDFAGNFSMALYCKRHNVT